MAIFVKKEIHHICLFKIDQNIPSPDAFSTTQLNCCDMLTATGREIVLCPPANCCDCFSTAPNAIPYYAQRPALGDYDSKPVVQCVEGSFWLLTAFACRQYCAEMLIYLLGSLYFIFNYVKAN